MIYAQVYFSLSRIPYITALGIQYYHFFWQNELGVGISCLPNTQEIMDFSNSNSRLSQNVSILFSADVLSAKEPLMDKIVLGEVRLERRGGRCPFGRVGQECIQRIL